MFHVVSLPENPISTVFKNDQIVAATFGSGYTGILDVRVPGLERGGISNMPVGEAKVVLKGPTGEWCAWNGEHVLAVTNRDVVNFWDTRMGGGGVLRRFSRSQIQFIFYLKRFLR